jgi:anti-sigma regulatory factor (Ser/Thr protein kinase)
VKKRFPRKIDALEQIFTFVSECADKHRLSPDVLYGVNLAIEELFTNMVRHAVGGGNEVLISLEVSEQKLVISLTDYDVDEFDPRKSMDVDVSKPLHERKPGGLGIFMVKGLMDDVSYSYQNRTASVTIVKKLHR